VDRSDAWRFVRESESGADWRRRLHGGDMRGILLWLLGVPIPVVILLYLFHVI
jgi:hypothetical protein